MRNVRRMSMLVAVAASIAALAMYGDPSSFAGDAGRAASEPAPKKAEGPKGQAAPPSRPQDTKGGSPATEAPAKPSPVKSQPAQTRKVESQAKKAEDEPQGLRGLLPPHVPEDLSADQFAMLGGNWADWSRAAAEEVARLYERLPADLTAQRRLVKALQDRLSVMETALADQRYAPIFDPLATLYGRLSRRVAVADAILDVLQQDPVARKKQRLAEAADRLKATVETLRRYLSSLPNGQGWLAYLHADALTKIAASRDSSSEALAELKKAEARLQPDQKNLADSQRAFLTKPEFVELRRAVESYRDAARQAEKKPEAAERKRVRGQLAELVAALEDYEQHHSSAAAKRVRAAYSALRRNTTYDITALTNALRLHYFNYNLRVVAAEAFLDRLVAQDREDTGPVDDWILGAKVDGQQWTQSHVGIDLKPSDRGARFDITLSGITQSQTQGVTEDATIYTYGYHRFWASKEVTFDGERFSTAEAQIYVEPSNTTTGASTHLNGLPIFGGIARGVAVREAQRRRPESEAEAAARVRRRVLPEFNAEVEKQFKQANEDLQKRVIVALKEWDLYPTACSIYTTDQQLLIRTQLMGPGELAASLPNPSVTTTKGLVIHVHESLINNTIRRMKLAGRTVTDAELRKEIEHAISRLLGRPFSFSDQAQGATKSESAEQAGPTTLVFDKIDPIRLRFADGKIILTIRTGLKQEEGKEDIPTQVITVPLELKLEGDRIVVHRGSVSVSPVERPKSRFQQIARAGVVRKKIQLALPDRQTDRLLHIHREGQEPIEAAVTAIKIQDGWLSVVIE
ncbi:MAG TPA: hypothetical protein EYP14_20615 [Planctomycetaceae bacterium]|nr:hypothetical protein [Planctomycetaceae bacterium]